MDKKLLLIFTILVVLGSCSVPLEVAICGNDICELGEDELCPADCVDGGYEPGAVSCAAEGGESCLVSDICEGFWVGGDSTCCSVLCDILEEEVALQTGWNYMSIPFVQLNDPVEDIFAGIDDGGVLFLDAVDTIYTYEGGWQVWHADPAIPSDLSMIEAGRGYIFVMNQDFTLDLSAVEDNLIALMDGSSRSPHSVSVASGWDLIGSTYGEEADKEKPLEEYFWHLDSYGSLWKLTWDGDLYEISLSENNNLVPTYAYWLYTTEDGEIIP